MFSLLMLFLCVILHNMSSGSSMQLLCIIPFSMLCLSAIRMMFGSVFIGGVWWSEQRRTLCLL